MDRQGMELLASAAGLPLRALINAGYTSREGLRAASDDSLKESLGLDEARLAELRRAIDTPVVVSDDAPINASDDAQADALADGPFEATADASPARSQEAAGDAQAAEPAQENAENSGTGNAV